VSGEGARARERERAAAAILSGYPEKRKEKERKEKKRKEKKRKEKKRRVAAIRTRVQPPQIVRRSYPEKVLDHWSHAAA